MLKPVILKGSLVQLEPLAIDHTQALCDAASENRTTYAYTNVPDGIEETKRYIERALSDYEKRLALPFAVRSLETDRIVGSTRFMDVEVFTRPTDAAPEVCEIGSTWYASAVQRTGVNTECKLLMLTHAFDVWQAVRVTLKTDVRNQRSRTAICGSEPNLKGSAAHTFRLSTSASEILPTTPSFGRNGLISGKTFLAGSQHITEKPADIRQVFSHIRIMDV